LDGLDNNLRAHLAGRVWAKTMRPVMKTLKLFLPTEGDDGTCIQTLRCIKPLILDPIEKILATGEVYEVMPRFVSASKAIGRRIERMIGELKGYRPRPQYSIMSGDASFLRAILSSEDGPKKIIGYELSEFVEYYKGSVVEGRLYGNGGIVPVIVAIMEIEENPEFNIDTKRYRLYSSEGKLYPIDWTKARKSVQFLDGHVGEVVVPIGPEITSLKI